MCRVLISNRGNNYCTYNIPQKEFDIPTELVPVLKDIFHELNAQRTTATEPIISIETL